MKIGKKFFLILFLLTQLSLTAKENSFLETETGEFKMTLLLESDNPAIREYEIEFWKNSENKKSTELPIRKRLKPGRNVLTAPAESQFFRVRAVALLNIRGYWTEFNPIKRFPLEKEAAKLQTFDVPKIGATNDLFLKIRNENGKDDLYLSAQKFNIYEQNGKRNTIFYRLGESEWQSLNPEGIEIKVDGQYQLEYYALDLLGNKEPIKQITFLKDSLTPETSLYLSGESYVNSLYFFISGNSFLSLFSNDNISGVDHIYFRSGCQIPVSSEWTIYQSPIQIKTLSKSECSGKIYVEYFAVDKAGNSESPSFKEIIFNNKND